MIFGFDVYQKKEKQSLVVTKSEKMDNLRLSQTACSLTESSALHRSVRPGDGILDMPLKQTRAKSISEYVILSQLEHDQPPIISALDIKSSIAEHLLLFTCTDHSY